MMLDLNVALMETTDSQQLMENIMQHAAEAIDCERCSIFTVGFCFHSNSSLRFPLPMEAQRRTQWGVDLGKGWGREK